jgi:hypothetical protein
MISLVGRELVQQKLSYYSLQRIIVLIRNNIFQTKISTNSIIKLITTIIIFDLFITLPGQISVAVPVISELPVHRIGLGTTIGITRVVCGK